MLPTVQGAHSHLLHQGDPYLPSALGRCSLLALAMPPEDNTDSAHSSLGAVSSPSPADTHLSAHHSTASALFDLHGEYCLIYILKSKMIPPTLLFLKQGRERSQGPFH